MPAYDIIRWAGGYRVVPRRARRRPAGWGGTAATRLLRQCRSRPSPRPRARARARLRPPAHPPSADQTWSSQHGAAPVHEHSVAEIANLSCRMLPAGADSRQHIHTCDKGVKNPPAGEMVVNLLLSMMYDGDATDTETSID